MFAGLNLTPIALQTVYVTVEGQFDVNEFSMLVWEMLFNPDVIEVTVEGNSPLNNPLVNVGDFIISTERFVYYLCTIVHHLCM